MKNTQTKTSAFILGGLLSLLVGPGWAQDFYFQPPTVLSDTVNSRAEESYPIYSARDSTLYFVRTLYSANVGGTRSGQDIWYTKRLPNGAWSLPANNLDQLNNRNNNAVVGVSKTGNTLYLLNAYQGGEANRPGMAFSFNQTSGWLEPNDVKIPKLADKIGNFYGIFVSSSEDVAILSMQQADAVGQEDLYVTFKDSFSGDWSDPMHLGDTVNTEGYEMSPFLSEDQRYLFFASNGHPGYGNADIFVSTRLDSTWTRWSEPRNLGDDINSAGFNAYLTIAANDEVFFVSNRYGRSADIYTSQSVSKEERDQQLASRIEGGRRPALDSTGRRPASSDLDAETQALLAETQALLDEFKGVKQPETNPTPATGRTGSAPTADDTRFLFFELNADALQTSSIPYLREVAGLLTKDPARNVVLVGHADDTGGKDYNLKLSIERAQAAKRFLIDQGVKEEQIVSYGRGSTQPLSEEEGPEARRKNRRVEIKMD